VDTLQSSVSAATGRLRALLFDLEPPDLVQGLTGALRRAAEEILGLTGIEWSVEGDDEPDVAEVPHAVRAIAYRIAQETLHNVRKHAGARHVSVRVRGRDGGLEVVIEDDGVGLTPESLAPTPGHRGILTMQQRAAVIGGSCTLSVPPGGGTRVTTWLPGR
jgi:signal transduction histidine kinase